MDILYNENLVYLFVALKYVYSFNLGSNITVCFKFLVVTNHS